MRVRLFAVVLVLAIAAACSSGGKKKKPTGPGTCLEFSSMVAPVAGVVVSRQGSDSTCETVVVEVVVTGVDDVFAADFDVDFDPAVASYQGYSLSGSLLTSDGAAVEVLEDVDVGRVTLGLTRLLPATDGIDVGNPAVLVKILFDDIGSPGSAALGYPRALLLDSGQPPADPPAEIPNVTWEGGTLTSQ